MAYAVPRRYDLAMLLTVTVSFALLFSLLRMLGAPPTLMVAAATFIALVGLAQAALFGGRSPRQASIVVGFLFGPIVVGCQALVGVSPVQFDDLLLATIWYAPLGYVLGVLTSGIFLVSDYLRRFMKWSRRDPTVASTAESTEPGEDRPISESSGT